MKTKFVPEFPIDSINVAHVAIIFSVLSRKIITINEKM